VPAALPEDEPVDDGVDVVVPSLQADDTAVGEHHDGPLGGCGHPADDGDLLGRQLQLVAVEALRLLLFAEAREDHRDTGTPRGLLRLVRQLRGVGSVERVPLREGDGPAVLLDESA